jgi:CBS domain-containing protein
MRTVEDILASKPRPFNFIEPDALVFDALQLMNSVNLSYLIVMHGNTFHGIFSERDYSRNVILKGLHSNQTPVKDVMSVALPMIGLNDSVDRCMELINTHKTRYLLVFDKGNFLGVVTINDLLREAMAHKDLYFDNKNLSVVSEMGDKIY